MKIRVIHLITRLVKAGADENTVLTVKGVDPEHFECDLLVGGESEIVDKVRAEGVNIVVVDSLVRRIAPLNDLLALIKITCFLMKNRYDIVHTHTAKAGILGRLAAQIAGVPIIVHGLHGLSFHDYMPKWKKKFYVCMERVAGRYTDLFISVGEKIKNKAIEERIGKPDKFVTIYSGMDLHRFENVDVEIDALKHSIGISGRELVLGTVVRIEPRKGPQYFIEVVYRIKKKFPNIKAIIVGSGYYRGELEDRVCELGLQDDVVFAGFREDIAEVMSLIDIVCLCSLWEGIPRVLVQGAKLGKPLVAFDIDGNSEIIHQGKNGFLVPPLELELFVEQTLKLLRNQNLRCEMAEYGRRLVDGRWDQNTMVTETERCYLDLYKQKIS